MSHKLTQKEFEAKFYKKYKDAFVITGKYCNAVTPISIECSRCHYPLIRTPNSLDTKNATCPVCHKNGNTRLTLIGINDMHTTNPEIAQYLTDPNDGYKYRYSTDKKLSFTCPQCNSVRMFIPRYYNGNFKCPYCSDAISYPNRFMANLLSLLEIDFVPEFRISKYLYRYDFFFEKGNIKYLIEMDGITNHGFFVYNNISKEEQIEHDRQKDKLAKEHGYVIIRIDCAYKDVNCRKDYVSKSIMQSPLAKLFDLDDAILDAADQKSHSSKCIEFANAWNSGIKSYEELEHTLHVRSRVAVRTYAKQSIALKLVPETYEMFLKIVRLASNKKIARSKGHPVICEQSGTVYESISQAERICGLTSLRNYFKCGSSFCGRAQDGTKLTWRKISEEEYKRLKKA